MRPVMILSCLMAGLMCVGVAGAGSPFGAPPVETPPVAAPVGGLSFDPPPVTAPPVETPVGGLSFGTPPFPVPPVDPGAPFFTGPPDFLLFGGPGPFTVNGWPPVPEWVELPEEATIPSFERPLFNWPGVDLPGQARVPFLNGE